MVFLSNMKLLINWSGSLVMTLLMIFFSWKSQRMITPLCEQVMNVWQYCSKSMAVI